MKYIDLYLQEVERRLPLRNREDILREIRSTLMDMIDDHNPDQDQPADEETIKSVLQEFGSPRQVAQRYSKHNYLIGPNLYPIYLQVLKIVLIIVAGFNVLGLIIAIASQTAVDSNLIEAIAETLAGLFSSLFGAFGMVTLSFAAIERTTSDKLKVKIEQEWKPEDLLKEKDIKRISITELAFEITFTLIFIVVINSFLDRIGIYYLSDGRWVSAPILNENFSRYVPWITTNAALGIFLDLYLIRKGYWDAIATIGKVFINALSIALSFVILTGPEFITVSASALQGLGFASSITAAQLTNILNIVIDVLLGLSIFGLVVESIKRIYESFIKGSHPHIEISN
jgi:hypothetical protein